MTLGTRALIIVSLAGVAYGQDPPRLPATTGAGVGNAGPDVPAGAPAGRIPVPVTAGVGNPAGILSFPQSAGGVGPQQPFVAPPPTLSPYLNLLRGGVGGRGVTAVDYFNFVRPFTDPSGPFGQRNNAPAAPFGVRGGGANVEPGTILPGDVALRSAGIGAGFMNYGGFFNRLGTIGAAGPRQAAPRAAGRR